MATLKNGPQKPFNKEILQFMPEEVQKIREIALNILDILDSEIKSSEGNEENPFNCDHIFGSRTSRVNALVTLADLLLRLPPVAQENYETALAISEEDMKLVNLLVERSRQQHHAPAG